MSEVGHNSRPVDGFGMAIDDLYAEGKNFLDGAPVKTEADATAIGTLLDRIRTLRKDADAQRKVEKAPHDAAAKAVQAEWSPLIEKCDRLADVAKAALTPFLEAQDAARQAEAAKARQTAQEAAHAAQAALRASTDLSAREAAEGLLKDAKAAERHAGKLDRARPQAAIEGRAIGLRASWQAEVTDYTAFGRWAWEHRRPEYEQFLRELAQRECRHGPATMPGVTSTLNRKAA